MKVDTRRSPLRYLALSVVAHAALLAKHIIHFSPVMNGPESATPGDLAEWILADRLPVQLQLQLHKVVWPGRSRAV